MNLDNLIIDGDFPTIAIWFAIYCFLGWVWESAYRSIHERKFVNSGFLAGPFIPIYGFGALLYIGLMHITLNPALLFISGAVLACTLEYITSWALEKIFHARWWDYDNNKFNINGRVCLLGFCAFGFFVVILPYLQLPIGYITSQLSETWRWIIAILFIIGILYDTFTTSRGLVRFNKTLARYQKEIERHAAPIIDFLTYYPRRIMSAFPGFKSILYPDAMKKIRKFHEESRKKIKKTQYKPQKVKKKKK